MPVKLTGRFIFLLQWHYNPVSCHTSIPNWFDLCLKDRIHPYLCDDTTNEKRNVIILNHFRDNFDNLSKVLYPKILTILCLFFTANLIFFFKWKLLWYFHYDNHNICIYLFAYNRTQKYSCGLGCIFFSTSMPNTQLMLSL